MKRLYFLIVAALVLCYVGCTTDVNELGAGAPTTTTLTVAVKAPTKVALGDQDSNGSYAACWSEGDKISVNGYISEEAVINPTNPGSAQFELKDAVLSYPYNILYPASTDNVVNFAAEQNYAPGSFESGTSPM